MTSLLHIAIPCPLRQLFDYLSDEPVNTWQVGMRVKVSFANRQCIGIVTAVEPWQHHEHNLKYIEQRIDQIALIPSELFDTIVWASQFYHHPIGECFQTALPKLLRQGTSAEIEEEIYWQKTNNALLKNIGNKQQACLDLLADYPEGLSQSQITATLGNVTSSLKTLAKKNILASQYQAKLPLKITQKQQLTTLNQQQQLVVEQIQQASQQFSPVLLHGITGSGKTEVYIHLTQQQINQQKQVLILIPEIGLTSQFVERFKRTLNATIVIMHSAISDKERKQAWLLAKNGLADVIIGTRSAIFTPLLRPGMIIIDEEHDNSYKQQDSLRYHTRHIALKRAQQLQLPIIMGSATPSLESLYQVEQQRYCYLALNQRAGGAKLPNIRLIDGNAAHPDHGLHPILISAIQQHLDRGNQVILFINRRGFAPVLMCHDCGWQASCSHCDARMVVHQQRHILFCHHCGYIQRLVEQCPKCHNTNLKNYGAGTEKIEHHLHDLFPTTPILRIDQDTTRRVGAFAELVDDLKQGQARILVGTQMLAKGHDFHHITLVGILDSDQGLYSADYRATESLAQLITQVTGRAGRGQKAGDVIIQSRQVEHPFWQQLLQHGYMALAQQLLQERKDMVLPPVANWTVIRAEAKNRDDSHQFLQNTANLFNQYPHPDIGVLGPVPALMEKKGGRYRAQLLLTCPQRKPIHQLLDFYIKVIERDKLARKVRWSIDIDPIDLF